MIRLLARRLLPLAESLVERLRVIGDVEPPPLVLEPGELDAERWRILRVLEDAVQNPVPGALAWSPRYESPMCTIDVRGHNVAVFASVEFGTLGTYRELHVIVASLTAPPRLLDAVATRVLPSGHSREWDDKGRLHVWGEP